MEAEISRTIPIPSRYRWPFPEMEVNDSFAVPPHIMREHIVGRASVAGKKLDRKFVVRKFGAGYRCWRIK